MKTLSKIAMERYMVHLKHDQYLPEHSREIVYRARDLTSDMNVSVRVARIASTFVELDIAIEKNDLDLFIEKVLPIGPVDNIRHVFEEKIEKEQGILDGIFYFNNERFWECHESFEGVWNQCYGREKELVQGIVLLAVAFAHGQKNDSEIGIGMLRRSLEKLGTSPSMYHSINIDKMRNNAIQMQQENCLTLFKI